MTTHYFHSKPRKPTTLFIGLGLLLGLGIYAVLIPPAGMLQYSIFFVLLLASLFYLVSFTLNVRRFALLLSGGVVLIVILRALELRSLLYPLLILALVFAIELFRRTSQKR